MNKSMLIAGISIILIILSLTIITFLPATANTNVTFSVNLTISGNLAPSVTWIQTGISTSPLEKSGRVFNVVFNATDSNGFDDINYTSANVTVTLNGEQVRTSTLCNASYNDTTGGLLMQLNCTVTMQYYDNSGSWIINASVNDLTGSNARNNATMTYGSLRAIQANKAGITFGSLAMNTITNATNDPLILNNTGNVNFTEANITAFNLIGATNPTYYINANRFYVNISEGLGTALSNNSKVAIPGFNLPRSSGGVDLNRSLYFWVSTPTSGLSEQVYTSSSNWIVDVGQ